ncbi:MAG: TonB-dependent receptor plug domain-containing protein, partial [Flavobacteriaceae bacterium]
DPTGILSFVGNTADPNSVTMHILANTAGGTAPNSSLSINDNAAFTNFGGTGFAHNAARGIANQGMIQPGTSEFDAALSRYTKENLPVVAGGSGIFDDTKTYNFELNYDLADVVDFADFLVGASYRMTELNSAGTIYADQDGPIEYFDYGAYVQGVKKLFNDKVTLTGSLRLDKAEFFDSNFTPRLAALINLSENQNLRFSYQTGFRNPTNQDQYIGLFAGDVTLFGTSPDNIDRYNGTVVLTNGSVATFTGDFVFNNSYNEDGTSSDLKHVSSEKVTSIDLGYRFNSNTTSFDISAYYSDFDNKIGSTNVYVPSLVDGVITMDNYRALGSYAIYQADSNSDEDLKTYGLSVEFVQALNDKLMFNLIYDYNKLDFTPDPSSDFEAAFNTPEHNIKGGIVGKLSNAISYNLSARYNSEYYYEASFIDGMIDSKTVLDAQVSFDLTDINAVLKVGGNNIGGKDYQSVLGGGNIGSVYYTSITFDF